MGAERSRNSDHRVIAPTAARRAPRRLSAALAGWIGVAVVTAWSAEPAPAPETPQQLRENFAELSDADKATVLQKKRKFEKLSLEEQTRLRQIHDELSRDPHHAELQRVLERYHDWLHTLTPAQRAEVLSLPADQRLAQIAELIQAQEAKRLRMMAAGFMMSPADLNVIHDWFDQFLDDHQVEILAALPDEPAFADLKRSYDRERDRPRLRFDYVFRRDPRRLLPSPQEEAELQTRVSKEAQQVLADADAEQRSKIILRWIGAAVLSRLRTNPSLEELDEFAQNKDFVSDTERAWLESLPRDRMYGELRLLYKQRRFAGDPSRRSPWAREPGGDRKPRPRAGGDFEGPPPSMPGDLLGKPDGRKGPPPPDAPPPGEPTGPPDSPGK